MKKKGFLLFILFWVSPGVLPGEEEFVKLQTGATDVRIEEGWEGVDWGATAPSGPPPHHYYRSPEEDAYLKSLEWPVAGFMGKIETLKGYPGEKHGNLILAPPIEQGFSGPYFNEISATSGVPPDPHIAVGSNNVGVVVNVALAFYSFTGVRQLYTSLDSWFGSLASGLRTFDPRILYDQYANRWVVVYTGFNSSSRVSYWLIAISRTSDFQGTWCKYRIASQDANRWIDFPLAGLDGQAIYLTGNMFDWWGTSVRSDLVVIPKNQLVSGCPANLTYFYRADLRVAGNYVATSVHPAIHYGPTSAGYLISENCCFSPTNFLSIWKVENVETSPTLSRRDIGTFSYSWPPDAPQRGGNARIATNDSRISATPVWRNGFLYATHPLNYNWGSGNRSAMVYYRIDTSNWNIVESRILGDADHWYYYPALTVDEGENIGMTFGRSSSSEYASAWYTFKLFSESEFQPVSVLRTGAGYYAPTGSSSERWGDYYGAGIDPQNRMWFFGEYVRSTHVWGTWIGMLQPAFPDISLEPISADYGSVVIGQTAVSTFTVRNTGSGILNIWQVSVSGSDFSLQQDACSNTTLSPSQFCVIKVEFSPTQAGERLGSLSVPSSDPDEPNIVASLRGVGITSASIEASPNPMDFGLVRVGISVEQMEVVANRGESPLQIFDVLLSGEGFALVEEGCKGRTLQMNETCTMKVQFAPALPGAYSGEIAIQSSDPNRNPLIVALFGTAGDAEISVHPLSLDFGVIKIGETMERSLEVRNDGTYPLCVGDISSSDGAFSVISNSCSGTCIAPGRNCWVRVKFVPTQVENYAGFLTIASDDRDENPALIPLTGEGGLPDILVTPTGVDFGPVWLLQPSPEVQIQVRNEGNFPLLVNTTQLVGEGFELVSEGCERPLRPLSWQVRPRDFCVFILRFVPQHLGAHTGSFSIFSDDPDEDENPVVIPLRGEGGLPDIAFSDTRVDFGLVAVYGFSERTITISNEGNLPLLITGFTGPAGVFSLLSENCLAQPLPPNFSCEVSIRFSPTVEGNFQGGFVVSSNDPDEGDQQITLVGNSEFAQAILEPGILDFGGIRIQRNARAQANLRNTGRVSLFVREVFIEGQGFEIASEDCSANPLLPDTSCAIQVLFSPAEVRSYQGRLWVRSNAGSNPEGSFHWTELSGRGVEAIIQVEPTSIDFGRVRLGQSVENNIVVQSVGSDSVFVSSVTLSGEGFTIPEDNCSGTNLPPQSSCFIKVRFSPSAVQNYNGEVEVNSDASAQPITVTLSGAGGRSDFSISPSDVLDFGNLLVGTSRILEVQGKTEGDFASFVHTVRVTGEDFSLFSENCSGKALEPGQVCQIKLQFAPSSVGRKSGELQIQIQDNPSGITLPLAGEAIAGNVSFYIREVIPPSQPVKRGATGVPALAFALRAGIQEDVVLSSLTLSSSGTGDDALHISDVKIWKDVDRNLVYSSGDSLLASGRFSQNNGERTFEFSSNNRITADSDEIFLITLDFSSQIFPSFARNIPAVPGTFLFLMVSFLPFLAINAFFLHRRKRIWFLWFALLIVMLPLWLGCGGGGGQPVQPSTFTYQLTLQTIAVKGATSNIVLPVNFAQGSLPYTGPEIRLTVP
ncbi:MAG: choice-of-anchor D domain-containing protein [bacterium JZ-2024 1]